MRRLQLLEGPRPAHGPVPARVRPVPRVGDEYRVLECDGGAILIEVLDDPDGPYFLSAEFLRTVSDFPTDDAAEEEPPADPRS